MTQKWGFEMVARLKLLLIAALGAVLGFASVAQANANDPIELARAAEGQVGVTTIYDPAYVRLAFPGGDVPIKRGVCTDVLVRAMRDAYDIDLQLVMNRDMRENFSSYPKNWGLTKPDRNIDHRRVPNLQRLLQRVGASIPIGRNGNDFQPGDIVTSMLPGNLPHLVIVSDRRGRNGEPKVIHNIGNGTRIESDLFTYKLTGHYRLTPAVLRKLRALQL